MKSFALVVLALALDFFGCLGGSAPTPRVLPTTSASIAPTATITASSTPTSSASVVITPSPTPSVQAAGVLKGFSLSPKSFSAADFTDFFEKAAQAGKVVTWAGDWNELGKDAGGPKVVAELSKQYGYEPVIIAQFFTQSSGQLLRPLDEANKKAYKEGAAAFASKYKPRYMGFGIEVNVLQEKNPTEFNDFAAFFSEVYGAVKAVSPDTKVFTTFELEKMKGLHGGLFGGQNDESKAHWKLLEKFPKSDVIAFSTYPELIYKTPAEIPEDYYSEINGKTTKPIIFTEIGWHSAANPVGWESNEAEQAEFVERFFALTETLKPEMAVWSFMFDPQTSEPFNTMGLMKSDGSPRQAWSKWLENE